MSSYTVRFLRFEAADHAVRFFIAYGCTFKVGVERDTWNVTATQWSTYWLTRHGGVEQSNK